jgi:DNA-binding MarR family transcriptional regulator
MKKRPPARPKSLETPLEFLRLLWRIEHGLQRVSKRMEATHGITGPQRLILRLVRERPDLTARELAGLLYLHASTVTGILQRLEKKGLIVRERDRTDNRRVKLRVPASAASLIDRPAGTIEAAIKAALSTVARARTRDAELVLAEIARALGAAAER